MRAIRLSRLVAVVILGVALASCTNAGRNKEIGGTLLGAGLGGLLGSRIGSGTGRLAAVAIGTLGGAFLGREVGKSLDRADRLAMQNTAQRAFERNRSGQASTWRNPDSGNSGTIAPVRTFQNARGQPCREFQQTVTIGGSSQGAFGTACRQADGSWQIVS